MSVATGTRIDPNLGRLTTFTGDSLRALAMPMGGLGAGHVTLAGDGSLRQWQISHEINHTGFVPHTFFAVWAKRHFVTPFDPAPAVNDHEIPAGCRELLNVLPGVPNLEYHGSYPIADLT